MEELLHACEFRPYKSFKDMERGEYPIKKFSVIATKFGDRIRVDLEDCHVYLPTRFQTKEFPQDRLDELNKKDVVLVFNGKEPGVNGR